MIIAGWPLTMPFLPATSGGEPSTLLQMKPCKLNIGVFMILIKDMKFVQNPCSCTYLTQDMWLVRSSVEARREGEEFRGQLVRLLGEAHKYK